MMDVKHCDGCENDFYNGKNPLGVTYCWHRKTAQLVPRLLIHIDQRPPYSTKNIRQVPACYKRKQFATVDPESLNAKGYWKPFF